MDMIMKHTGSGQGRLGAAERRISERVSVPFPVLLSGADTDGKSFEFRTVLDNFGAGGLYVRLPMAVRVGANLTAMIRLSLDENGSAAPGAATQGRVVRSEELPDGSWGIALAFTWHSFLYADGIDEAD